VIALLVCLALKADGQGELWQLTLQMPLYAPGPCEEAEDYAAPMTPLYARSVGRGLRNCYETVSQEELEGYVDTLRQEGRPITVSEFLGGEIAEIVLTYVDPHLSPSEAEALVRDFLASIVISPDHPNESPQLVPGWAELVPVQAAADLHFTDGSRGKIEIGGSHLAVKDRRGIVWFERWWAHFPRRTGAVERTSPESDG